MVFVQNGGRRRRRGEGLSRSPPFLSFSVPLLQSGGNEICVLCSRVEREGGHYITIALQRTAASRPPLVDPTSWLAFCPTPCHNSTLGLPLSPSLGGRPDADGWLAGRQANFPLRIKLGPKPIPIFCQCGERRRRAASPWLEANNDGRCDGQAWRLNIGLCEQYYLFWFR